MLIHILKIQVKYLSVAIMYKMVPPSVKAALHQQSADAVKATVGANSQVAMCVQHSTTF